MYAWVLLGRTYNVPQLVPPTAESYGEHRCALLGVEGLPAILIDRSCKVHMQKHDQSDD